MPRSRSARGTARYKRVLLSYADLLGFRTSLRTRSASDIREALATFREGTRPDREFANKYEVSFHTFSDLIVRTTPLTSAANEENAIGLLYQELHDLALAQAAMVGRGFLVRGAVTIGKLHCEPDMIFGDALVRAYELESRVALYPRIIVDPEVLALFEQTSLLKSSTNDPDEEGAFVRDLLSCGSDNVYFIDYLGVAIREDEEHAAALLKAHASLLYRSASRSTALDETGAKLNWLATYHNQAAEKVSGQDLSIVMARMPTIFRFRQARPVLPLPDDLIAGLFRAVGRGVRSRGCDGSLRITRKWLGRQVEDPGPAITWIENSGGGCDCEVASNVAIVWAEVSTRRPWVRRVHPVLKDKRIGIARSVHTQSDRTE